MKKATAFRFHSQADFRHNAAVRRPLAGKKGAQLLAFSTADGKRLSIQDLEAMPTFDGMIAAKGRLLLTTVNGKVLCLGHVEK